MNFGERPTFFRKTLGVLAIVVAIAAATAVFVQILDLMGKNVFVWSEFFSYFTIIVTLLSVVALLFGGVASLQSERDSTAHTLVRQSLVTYAVVSGGVYHLLLSDLTISPDAYVSADSVPMQIFHTYLPLYLLIDWLINPYRQKSPRALSTCSVVVVLPALWLAATLYRGEETGWYPYRFLNPGSEAGWTGVWEHVLVMAVALVVVQLVLLGTNRLLHRSKKQALVTV
jgi:hypothetical protein